VAPIETEIRRFLADASPEVLCIRGEWGVGKTYAWKKFLKEALANTSVRLNTYSYVSLFGLSSIRDLKRAIFENQVTLSLSESPNASTLARNFSKMQGATRRGLHAALQLAPVMRNAAEELATAAFTVVRDQIVCLDDLERVGQGLRVKDVLGLVSYLKEERACKLVLLLNGQQMSEENRKDFEEQLEKVVDVELEFAPSAVECCDIGLSEEFPLRSELEHVIVALGIANIRTIKRIERMALQALTIVSDLHENVRKQVIMTVAIGVWAKHQPNDAPNLDYLKRYNAFSAAWDEQKEGADAQKRVWNEMLQKVGYSSSDELDAKLLQGVGTGYFDPKSVREAAIKVDGDHAQSERGSSYTAAWRLYHNSFQKNDNVVLDAMFEAVKREPEAINPSNMNASIRLFRELGRDRQASEMIGFYVEGHADNRDFFDLTRYPFEGDVTDEELRNAFAERYASFKDERDPAQVILECARRSGWSREDEELLGKLTVDDFVRLFDKLDGEDTPPVVKFAIRMGRPSTTEGKSVGGNATEALRIIAKRSPLNRRRVQGYGIPVELPKGAKKLTRTNLKKPRLPRQKPSTR
jgi:hypothetical protein